MCKFIMSGLTSLLIIFLFSGCWDSEELVDAAFLVGVAVEQSDIDKNKIKVTYEMLDPIALQNNEKDASVIISVESDTAQQSVRLLTIGLKRRLFLSHLKASILQTDLAREKNIFELFDPLYRDSRYRLDSYLFIADDPAQLLDMGSPLDNIISGGLGKGVEVIERNISILYPPGKSTFLEMSMGPTGCAFAIMLKPHIEEVGLDHVDIGGAVIFKDGHYVKELNGFVETRGMLWFLDLVKNGKINFPAPSESEKNVSIDIEHKPTTSIKAGLHKGHLTIDVQVEAKGDIIEWDTDQHLDENTFREVEKGFSAAIKAEMEASLKMLQDDPSADVIQIGREVHRQLPQYWHEVRDEWDELFKTLEINIVVNGQLKESRLIQDANRPRNTNKKPETDSFPWGMR